MSDSSLAVALTIFLVFVNITSKNLVLMNAGPNHLIGKEGRPMGKIAVLFKAGIGSLFETAAAIIMAFHDSIARALTKGDLPLHQ